MKRLVAIAALLVAFVSASAASAATTTSAAGNPAKNAYPLTITVQSRVTGGGEFVPYIITVTNHSDHLRIAPVVFLDYFAVPAQNMAGLGSTYNPSINANMRSWLPGTLRPGQTRTTVLWYSPVVVFPSYTDPFTGVTYNPPPAVLGQDYNPVFSLYDYYFKYYTTAVPAAPPFGGGK